MIFWNKYLIFHGDIKPGNIVFFESEVDSEMKFVVKLIDFAGGSIKELNPSMTTSLFYNSPNRKIYK